MTEAALVVAPAGLAPPEGRRDLLWERCRNSLGIARLLAHEGRPEALVAAASDSAVETACRAALAHAGMRFDEDVAGGLARLAAPGELMDTLAGTSGMERVAATERVIAWVSDYLRGESPDRSWSF